MDRNLIWIMGAFGAIGAANLALNGASWYEIKAEIGGAVVTFAVLAAALAAYTHWKG